MTIRKRKVAKAELKREQERTKIPKLNIQKKFKNRPNFQLLSVAAGFFFPSSLSFSPAGSTLLEPSWRLD
jgi:hypothetical protein